MKDNLFQNSIKALGKNAAISALALILIGIMFLISPVSSMVTIARAIGIILMIAGIMEIVIAVRSTGRPISLLTAGSLLLVLVGLWVFLHPSFILSSINLVLGVIIVVSAVSSLGQAAQIRRSGRDSSLSMVLSIAGIILGVLIIVRPESFVEFIIILAGAFILLSGIMNFCQTLSLALLHYRYWWIGMIISILTIMLSVLVMTKPGKIADIVFIITGASMIYDGATNLWVAMKLRWFSRKVREGISDTVDGQY